jgi:hypothetical protein
MKKIGFGVLGVMALSAGLVAPANAAYYQQVVSGSTQAQCEAAGQALVREKQALGYLVTFVGCGRQGIQYAGTVGWSD